MYKFKRIIKAFYYDLIVPNRPKLNLFIFNYLFYCLRLDQKSELLIEDIQL